MSQNSENAVYSEIPDMLDGIFNDNENNSLTGFNSGNSPHIPKEQNRKSPDLDTLMQYAAQPE